MNYVSTDMSLLKKIIKAIIILLILFLLILLAALKIKNNKKTTTENTNINELNKKDYAYLLSRLYPNSCAIEDISTYIDLDNLSSDVKIEVAIASINPTSIKAKETDEFDSYNEEVDIEWLKQFFDFGVKATDVDKKIKEIFGGQTIVEHKSTEDVIYDKTVKGYINPPHVCGNYTSNWFQSITKVTKENDEIYIYTIAGSLINKTEEQTIKLCYTDDYKNLDEKSCISLSLLDKKYKNNDLDLHYDYEQYALDNEDKFVQYKYTFKKENKNFIFKKLEKIK